MTARDPKAALRYAWPTYGPFLSEWEMQLRTRKPNHTWQDAETLAVAALSYLAAEPDRLAAFLAETGIGPETVRGAAADPGFLPAVLDHLIAREPMLLAFAQETEVSPEAVVAARDLLAGRESAG
jgi:hypothetical protein